MAQDYNEDRREKQLPINFDDRRKIPYDYKKKMSLTWQQISVTVLTAMIIGLLSFLGANYIDLNKTVQSHEIRIEKIITASPSDQPQIVVNEEFKHKIETLSGQLEDVSFDFSELKRSQISLRNDFNGDLKEIDTTLDEISKALIKIQIVLEIE